MTIDTKLTKKNSFEIVSTITDDNGKKWDIVHTGTYGHHALMEPESPTITNKPIILGTELIKGVKYVKLDDVLPYLEGFKS